MDMDIPQATMTRNRVEKRRSAVRVYESRFYIANAKCPDHPATVAGQSIGFGHVDERPPYKLVKSVSPGASSRLESVCINIAKDGGWKALCTLTVG